MAAEDTPRRLVLRVGPDAVVTRIHETAGSGAFAQAIAAGESLQLHVHPEDYDLVELMLRAARERTSRQATIRLRWAQGDRRWSRTLATFQREGDGGIQLVVEPDDLASARRAETQMRRVVEGSAQGIVVRTATRVLFMNDSFAKLLGYASVRECIDSQPNIDSIIHPDDRQLVLDHLQARVSGREAVSHYDFRLLRRDRSVVWVETYAAMVVWNGQPASLAWISDISRRKALEAKLRASKEEAEFANRSKTEFLANMSHDLRTPLNAILGFSEMIAQKMFGPINVRYAEYAKDIHKSGEHLLELVGDVLDLSKLEAGKLELRESGIDLDMLIDEVMAMLRNQAEEARVAMTVASKISGIMLRGDKRSVKQVLLNLLSNAVKFTPEGGTVTLTADCDGEGRIGLSVADTGIGMSDADIAVALSPFGQIESHLARKYKGTGLGLPICKSLVQLHGGTLTVCSRRNCGTTITARFPAERTIAPALKSVAG